MHFMYELINIISIIATRLWVNIYIGKEISWRFKLLVEQVECYPNHLI